METVFVAHLHLLRLKAEMLARKQPPPSVATPSPPTSGQSGTKSIKSKEIKTFKNIKLNTSIYVLYLMLGFLAYIRALFLVWFSQSFVLGGPAGEVKAALDTAETLPFDPALQDIPADTGKVISPDHCAETKRQQFQNVHRKDNQENENSTETATAKKVEPSGEETKTEKDVEDSDSGDGKGSSKDTKKSKKGSTKPEEKDDVEKKENQTAFTESENEEAGLYMSIRSVSVYIKAISNHSMNSQCKMFESRHYMCSTAMRFINKNLLQKSSKIFLEPT